jgi:hypothetical protein
MVPRLARALLAVAIAAPLAVGPASAQVIAIKTVPVAAGDQFLIFPSDHLGMGAVSIALADSAGDPFSNPATLGRLQEPVLFGSPTAYGITGNNGGAMTLPLGGLFDGADWGGGIGVALQEMDRGQQPGWPVWSLDSFAPPAQNQLSQRSRTNLYGYGALSRRLDREGRTSLGVAVTAADLTAVGGVDLLYGRQTVDQGGSLVDVRLGFASELSGGQSLEAVVLHSRFRMRHELVDRIWEPVPADRDLPPEEQRWQNRWVESTERDETDTWGLHLNYQRPLAQPGWRVGGILTVNYKSHPKIPNYTLMSIPRDPGDSWAYDIGVGITRRTETAVFGLDVVYEPIWTETWADAATDQVTVTGDTVPAGDMTVFNDFRFNNAILRLGIAGHQDRLDLQAGLQLRAYRYTLDQTDFVADRRRRQHENWIEWTPSVAVGLHFDDFAIRYTGRATTGAGRPGVAWEGDGDVFAVADAGRVDYIPAPSGALTLQDETVHTHQIAVTIPFGR